MKQIDVVSKTQLIEVRSPDTVVVVRGPGLQEIEVVSPENTINVVDAGPLGPPGPTGPQGAVGPVGPAGIYVGTTPPSDTNVLWYDTN